MTETEKDMYSGLGGLDRRSLIWFLLDDVSAGILTEDEANEILEAYEKEEHGEG